MKRVAAYAAMPAVALLVSWPALQEPPQDSFPLSTYPMFSSAHTRVELFDAVVRTNTNAIVALPPEVISASSEAMQVVATLRGAVVQGTEGMQRLCSDIAARIVQRAGRGAVFRDAREVQLRRHEVDPVAYFTAKPPPTAAQPSRDTAPALHALASTDVLWRCALSIHPVGSP